MELNPTVAIVGGALPAGPAGRLELELKDLLEAAWSELAPSHGFTEMQHRPGGRSVRFVGPQPDDRLIIEPPAVRSRRTVVTGAEDAARVAASAVAGLARMVGAGQLEGLVVHYHARASGLDREPEALITEEFVGSSPEDLEALRPEGSVAAGIRYVVPRREATFELRIAAADGGLLGVDLIARFAEPVALREIGARADQVGAYLGGPVTDFLGRHLVAPEASEA